MLNIYISTIATDAEDVAREYGFGLEIAEFCTAFNMDEDFATWDAQVRAKMQSAERFIFHAPFNELCPAAIDPMIVKVAERRYEQAYKLMCGYGINTMVVHSGFIPMVYYEDWFVSRSIEFWKRFLSDKPGDFRLYLENVLEDSPKMLCEIVAGVDDPRFRLCLDIGHAAIVGRETPLTEWAERMLPLLGHVHLHNNYAERDNHNALGDGSIDIAPLLRMITEMAPAVTFTIETAISGKPSADWLRTNGFLGCQGTP